METSTAAPAAPAQPAEIAPQTQTAVEHAATTGNFREFRAARRAERTGIPLPVVPVATDAASVDAEPPAAAAGEKPAEKGLSKRQQDINERAQRAVESATTTLREENARLRAQLASAAPAAPVTEPKAAAAPAVAKFPTLAEYSATHPDASLEDYLEARDEWRESKAKTDATARTERERAESSTRERVTSFDTRVNELAATDPAILAKVLPVAQHLGALGKNGGPARYLSDLALDSPAGPRVLVHLHEHPEALNDLLNGPAAIRGLPMESRVRAHLKFLNVEFGKLEERYASAAARPVAPPKTLTDAPAMDTLGTRPAEAADPVMSAVRSGDFKQFRAAKRARMTASKG